MERKLKILKTFVYYDEPQVFSAQDILGTLYICMLIDKAEDDTPIYLAVAVSFERYMLLTSGQIDLRFVFEHPHLQEWYISEETIDNEIIIKPVTKEFLTEDVLPDSDFYLQDDDQENLDSSLLEDVKNHQNVVIYFRLKDEYNSNNIHLETLADLSKLLQSTITYTFKTQIDASFTNKKTRAKIKKAKNHNLWAKPAKVGSFILPLISKSEGDLFDYYIEYAIKKLDEILENIDDENELIERLQTIKGHAVSSIKKLTERIIEDKINVSYSWTTPKKSQIKHTEIKIGKAERLRDLLEKREELSKEIREFIGYIKAANINTGTWRILDEELQQEFNGDTDNSSLIEGVEIETKRYKLICEEKVELLQVTNRKKITYNLISIESL